MLESIDLALKNRLVPDLLFTYTDENISALEGVIRLGREKKLMVILDPLLQHRGSDPVNAQTHAQAIEYSKHYGVYLNRAFITLRKGAATIPPRPYAERSTRPLSFCPTTGWRFPAFIIERNFCSSAAISDEAIHSPARRDAAGMQGRHSFCEECHINCYFDPSFRYMRNRLFAQSLASKLGYAWQKHVAYRHPFPSSFQDRVLLNHGQPFPRETQAIP